MSFWDEIDRAAMDAFRRDVGTDATPEEVAHAIAEGAVRQAALWLCDNGYAQAAVHLLDAMKS